MIERTLTRVEGQDLQEVKITIAAPVYNGSEFECVVQIVGGHYNTRDVLYGEDSLQAMAIAIQFCRKLVTDDPDFANGTLYWGEPRTEWVP